MTPAELREYAIVMREWGVHRLTLREGIVEMGEGDSPLSDAIGASLAAADDTQPSTPNAMERDKAKRRAQEAADALLFAAVEGFPEEPLG